MELATRFLRLRSCFALYLELIKAGKLSPGMQKRIERAVSGNKVPGYYPLGKTPVPLW
ncbi:Uncharacterised protein [Mycobacterium tuberculosis]|nr:Uncharacterised protein [Mycobacterium tuberculosis]CNE02263.1 Uncharacterised protein [Mycobacterium tuberculosis]